MVVTACSNVCNVATPTCSAEDSSASIALVIGANACENPNSAIFYSIILTDIF